MVDELLYRMALEQALEAVLLLTTDPNPPGPQVVYVNSAFTALTGYAPEEMQGKPVSLLEGAKTRPAMLDALAEVRQHGQPRSWRAVHYRKGGAEILLEVSVAPLRDQSGNIAYFMAVLRDVTEQSRVEEALRQNERLLQHISDTLPAVLYIYNLEAGRLTYVSRESLTIVGYLPTELTAGDLPLQQMLHPDDLPRVQREMLRLLHAPEGAMVEAECRVRHRTDEWRWLMLRTTVFDRSPDGEAKQLLGVAIDVTESRRLREQVIQSSKLEGLGRLAGGVAHDFNNLLTIIQSYAEMAEASLPEEHPARVSIQQILKASEQASNLTGQMLTFARRGIISPKVLNLNDIVREAEAFLQRVMPENIRLVTALAPDLWHVYADPTQIEQVILNLALNARDAMPEGGVLTIETANVILDDSYVSRHAEVQAGEFVLLAVSDTGVGMDERTLARVFEPFFTTKETGKGTGLGLSTCYGIVKQAGGSIWVYSEPGKGTTFKVYLPRTLQTPAPSAEQTAQRKARTGSETILVVEDNDDVRAVAVESLRLHGYRVLEASSGEEALQLMSNLTEAVHLLLTDVVMPGMSGAELALELHQRYPHLKVLYTSGYTENVIVHHGVLNEGIAFLPKPYRPAELAQRVREVLDAE
ncbi:MAG: PAS domain S-box protein [Chthonomonadetes bacterium]|nr:PAS domain S-box protein [Chthonomonadetes bacterium]